jgi:hypothetical protein
LHFANRAVAQVGKHFDEMSRLEHEPKAFREFIQESGRKFELVAADDSLNNAFFRCLASFALVVLVG